MPLDWYSLADKGFYQLRVPNTDCSGQDITNDGISLHTPLECFRKFVSEDMSKTEDAADTVRSAHDIKALRERSKSRRSRMLYKRSRGSAEPAESVRAAPMHLEPTSASKHGSP
ncbi:hypothetical protein DPX16_19704 [Anabarilius grahami]|uniref:Uncharacterized protein n=1 Tax=Anabarilius grahami TaxID=495550 RepID=A0A3N0XQ00_ANAGA|nr:hypothetical protein DPX16_19704 [Anabarilius grahami]